MLACVEYFKSIEDGQWYFQLKAPNGGILVQSGGHVTVDECLYGIEMLRNFADVAPLIPVGEMSVKIQK